jgi:choline dehydrogenase-like flavoprotein
MRVFSEGQVSLRSDDPYADPIVDLCSLSDQRDVVRLRDGVRRMVEIVQRPSMLAIAEHVIVPNSTLDRLDSDDAIEEWLPSIVGDYVHVVGTCRMGRPGDPRAVVDPDCAVHGYQALRVVDASVMPDLPKCNTHLTTVAIAERFMQRRRSCSNQLA